MTTVTLPRRLPLPLPDRPGTRSFVLGFGATLGLAIFLLAALSVGVALATDGRTLPHVSVGSIQIGGLSRAEAEDRLSAALPSLSAGSATIMVDGEEAAVDYAEIGRRYDLEAMLDAAFEVGRSSGPLGDAIARLRSLVVEVSLPVAVHAFDEEALGRVSARVADQFTVRPVDASASTDGAEFVIAPATAGIILEAATVRDALAAVAGTTDPASITIELTPTPDPPTVSTAEAEAAVSQAVAMIADLALVVGEGEAQLSLPVTAETIRSWISFGPDYGIDYEARVDATAVTTALEALVDEVDQEPRNATYSFAGAGVGGVVPGQEGRELDVAASVEALLGGLEERASGGKVPSVSLVVDVTEPVLTTAEAEAALAEMQLVGSWTTYYTPEPGNHFGNNINIPAFDINGKVLAPGEWFSFWGSVGPITPERGFGYGGVIIGGRSVAGGAIGGGICSTSTTLFNAALRAGLEMGERANHYYYIPRYPTGLDATVYMDENFVQDMTFRNDTENPIVIRGFGGTGFVTFELYGVPDGRSVVLSDASTWNHRSAIETTEVSANLAPGTVQRVEYPHDGFEASVTRWVYNANGDLRHQDTYYSYYGTVNGITLVGPTAAAAPAPQPPADEGGTAGGGVGDTPPPGEESQP